jgi:hypothetical protein
MPRHPLIGAYLRDLRHRLPVDIPADAIAELTDGLTDTYDHFRGQGLDPDAAAHAALADFGDPSDIAAAFTHNSPARRAARALLATGPLLAGCWVLALLTGHAWRWPIPVTARLGFAAALVAVVVLLATATRTANTRTRHRSAIAGTGGLLLLDSAAIGTVALTAPALTGPLLLAIAASLTRACLTAPTLRGLPTGR